MAAASPLECLVLHIPELNPHGELYNNPDWFPPKMEYRCSLCRPHGRFPSPVSQESINIFILLQILFYFSSGTSDVQCIHFTASIGISPKQ